MPRPHHSYLPSRYGDSTTTMDGPFQCITTHSEEIPSDIQSKPLLPQVEIFYLCLSTYHLRKETDTHLAATSSQVVVESNEVSPQSPFLPSKPPQFPQSLLLSLVFWPKGSEIRISFFTFLCILSNNSCGKETKIKNNIQGAISTVPCTRRLSLP